MMLFRKKSSIILALLTIILISCDEQEANNANPINLGDRSTIVTEEDSTYLKNYTRDISKGGNQSQDQIAKMMVQVDSLKATQELEKSAQSTDEIRGFEVEFAECSFTFDGLQAKELEDQDELQLESVTYLVTKGELESIRVSMEGLQDVFVEERIFTKLELINDAKETIQLKTLGRKISDWFNLATNDSLFISAGANSIQFNNTTQSKIKAALQKELTSQNSDEQESAEWLSLIKETNNYTDKPCKVFVSTAQFRIGGSYNGKKVRKLIQFDLIE